MIRFRIVTLGCKVNRSESDSLAQGLMGQGWEEAEAGEPADVCVINTCAVTGKAAMQSRGEIRRAVRSEGRVIVMGCYAQTEPHEIEAIPGVNGILGTADKDRRVEYVVQGVHDGRKLTIHRNIREETQFPLTPLSVSGKRTRAFLKIQDGCNAFCSYCIVPYARGRSRSMPVSEVLSRLGALGEAGYREIVLAGIHLGRYGLDLNPPVPLVELMRRIRRLNQPARIRLSSLEPNEITDEIISLVASSDTFCRHFHLPLQSGDDRILEKMRRDYTSDLFKSQVRAIRERIPDAAIGADVLAGFPGESDSCFQNTYSLIKSLPLTYLHVFPFSPRKGTLAEKYPDKVSAPVIAARCKQLRRLGNEKKREFYTQFTGKQMEALIIESSSASHPFSKGLTSNYMAVRIRGAAVPNSIQPVQIEQVDEQLTIFGKTLTSSSNETEKVS